MFSCCCIVSVDEADDLSDERIGNVLTVCKVSLSVSSVLHGLEQVDDYWICGCCVSWFQGRL